MTTFSLNVYLAIKRGFICAQVRHNSGKYYAIVYKCDGETMMYGLLRSFSVPDWMNEDRYKFYPVEEFLLSYEIITEVRDMKEYVKRLQMDYHTSETYSDDAYKELAPTEQFGISAGRMARVAKY